MEEVIDNNIHLQKLGEYESLEMNINDKTINSQKLNVDIPTTLNIDRAQLQALSEVIN